MSIGDDKSGGTKAATATQTQTNAPWSGALPYINTGLQGAQNLYQSGGPQYYPGQTYAGSNPALNSGIDQLNNISSFFGPLTQTAQGAIGGAINAGHNVANNAQSIYDRGAAIGSDGSMDNQGYSFFKDLSQGKGPGLSTLQDYASGKYLNADNPYFSQMADNIKAQVLPSINGSFSQAGRGVSGLAGRAQGQGLGDAIGSLAYNNYQQGLSQQQNAANALAGYGVQGGKGLSDIYQGAINNRLNSAQLQLQAGNQSLAGGNLALQGAQLAPSIQNMGINAGNASLLAGTTAQGIQQGALTDAQKRWDYGQNLPQQNLQDYIRNITGQIGGTGMSTSSGTSTPAQPSFWNQLLSGGLAASSFFV